MSNDLVTTGGSALPALPDKDTLDAVFRENFDGIAPSFPAIKIPSGGLTAWEVPGETEEADVVKELVGVILAHYPTRAYWDSDMGEGGGRPPTCMSLDAKHGSQPRNDQGEFGECASCKWAQFGTAVKNGNAGRGQACSLKHRVFLVMPDRGFIPYMVSLATTSATKKYPGSLSTYAVNLSGKLKKLSDVVTKIKLIKDKNADNIEFAKAQFFFVSDLTAEDKAKIEFLKTKLGAAMRSKPVEMDEGEESGGNGATKNDPWD